MALNYIELIPQQLKAAEYRELGGFLLVGCVIFMGVSRGQTP
jgi:hypothetical protein